MKWRAAQATDKASKENRERKTGSTKRKAGTPRHQSPWRQSCRWGRHWGCSLWDPGAPHSCWCDRAGERRGGKRAGGIREEKRRRQTADLETRDKDIDSQQSVPRLFTVLSTCVHLGVYPPWYIIDHIVVYLCPVFTILLIVQCIFSKHPQIYTLLSCRNKIKLT